MVAAIVIVLFASAPLWLRSIGFFEVRQVEVIGARYLDPGSIVAALDLGSDHNLFESVTPLEEIVSGIAGVRAVEIERRLPATLRVAIVERQPIALVPGPGGMIALDSEARPLPYDPAGSLLNLPIAATSDREITRTLALIRSVDAAMYRELVSARLGGAGALVVEFAGQEVLLAVPPLASDILGIAAVRRHVAEGGPVFDRLDARFDGLVVARRLRT